MQLRNISSVNVYALFLRTLNNYDRSLFRKANHIAHRKNSPDRRVSEKHVSVFGRDIRVYKDKNNYFLLTIFIPQVFGFFPLWRLTKFVEIDWDLATTDIAFLMKLYNIL